MERQFRKTPRPLNNMGQGFGPYWEPKDSRPKWFGHQEHADQTVHTTNGFYRLTCRKGTMKEDLAQPLFRHSGLVVAPCEFGHGVFTNESIPADTTVEECHHLRIREEDCVGILNDYVYHLESDESDAKKAVECYSLPLGCGSIYNHAENHNIEYWHDTTRDLIIFYTITDVSAGEQLFINYGEDWWETRQRMPVSDK